MPRNYKPATFQPTLRPSWDGALSYCLRNNGLTDKQAKITDKYFEKYKYLFERDCNE